MGTVFGKPSSLAKAFDYTPFDFSLPLFPSKYYPRSRAQFALNGKRYVWGKAAAQMEPSLEPWSRFLFPATDLSKFSGLKLFCAGLAKA